MYLLKNHFVSNNPNCWVSFDVLRSAKSLGSHSGLIVVLNHIFKITEYVKMRTFQSPSYMIKD